jgi:hypothetical protein
MSLHIIFSDGSNPYIRYNMDPVTFAQEVLKWSENFSLVFDKTFGEGIVQIIATAKNAAPVDTDAPF